MDDAAHDLWPRGILNTALFAISFFYPSTKRDWRAMGAQYWCRIAHHSADIGRLLGDVTNRGPTRGEGCSSALTPQAAGDTVSPAAWRKGFRFRCLGSDVASAGRAARDPLAPRHVPVAEAVVRGQHGLVFGVLDDYDVTDH